MQNKETHASFGMIAAHRYSGGPHSLFGSPIQHLGGISISVKQAEIIRDNSTNWFHGREELIRVELSPAQFGEFLVSLNMGDGVPCTIRRFNGKSIPPNETATTDREKLTEEFGQQMNELASRFDSLLSYVIQLESNKKANKGELTALKNHVGNIIQEIKSNLPFVVDQFNEAMEKVGLAAKAEIEAYTSSLITNRGLEGIQELPKLLQ